MSQRVGADRLDHTRLADAEAIESDGLRLPPARVLGWIATCGGVVFVDSKGIHWCVSEQAHHAFADVPPRRCLVFVSESIVRRVLEFPPDWRKLAPSEFEALSWKR